MLSRQQLVGLVALTLMWGVNWPMMKLSLQELTPLYFRAFTMTGGTLWLAVFFYLRGVRMVPYGASEWRSIVTLGLPNLLGWHTLSIFGVQALASGRAAILGFTMPVWTVLLGALFFGQRLTRRSVAAALAVLLAVSLLLADEWGNLAGSPFGVVVMLGAAICWAIGTLMMRRAQLTLPVEALTVWMMALTSVCMWLMAAASEPWPQFQFSVPMWISLAYGVVFNYGFAQIIWFSLARHLPPATSAMSVMLVPLIGTASATLIMNEWPRWQDGVAVLCVMVAIAAVLLPPGSLRRAWPR
ncbi:permease of the drug/metabolite transporter DMT superfamily [Serpentinimonas maccroryi]|uniref:Permease of the drug/metabolite transporter DMT superfamily n=1 Tax=Serpentinimonas maccroryi TaxID=1458426 RepID=A0A060NVZ3_9BURK|nr:DMT family transporter [Serpentinimonas maccroryi]BAO83079.1 permease of the drug/metabolite transporter DMT superfamily [Serpentinimonas maccroryi]